MLLFIAPDLGVEAGGTLEIVPVCIPNHPNISFSSVL